MIILGIESSCDETGVALVQDGKTILSQSLASSMDIHAKYGGVIPEIAARSHIEAIIPTINETLAQFSRENLTNTNSAQGQTLSNNASDVWSYIDGIAVTNGAGLSGSLLIGVLTARTLSIVHNLPLYEINHVEAHVYANFLVEPQPQFPLLALIVSGGHTQLVYFRNHFDYDLLGQTVDDAIGEAFDKVAKILGLPYPGGPNVAKAAEQGNPFAVELPKAKVHGDYNFSFSGLKTAVLRASQALVGADYRLSSTELPQMLTLPQKNDIAASFQRVAVETVVDKTLKAYYQYLPNSVVIAGGVAANTELQNQLKNALPVDINFAPISLYTDNGTMVATLGCFKAMRNIEPSDKYSLQINPNLKM